MSQEQDNEKRLFCIDCGNWGWEENGLWVENYDGDTYIGQVWICIHCIEIGTPEEAYRVALSLSNEEVEQLKEEEENEAKARAYYADERNHLYVDSNGVGIWPELP